VGGQGYGSFRDAPQTPQMDPPPPTAPADDVLTRNLPAGNYLILGKVQMHSAFTANNYTICRTIAGGDFDQGALSSATSAAAVSVDATTTMAVFHSSSGPFTVHLACVTNNGNDNVAFGKIVAIRLRSVNNSVG
jgi:hypothetical protein